MTRIPVIRGLIDRRILVNFRVGPELLQAVLPPPFRPKLAHGFGMAGICLIPLAEVRPPLVPRFLGIGSENAAHRIAVEWDTAEGPCEGVYIPAATPRRASTCWWAAGCSLASTALRPYDALELRSLRWAVEPLDVDHVEPSFFSDRARFPPGSVELDCALLMRRIAHEWHAHPRLRSDQ